MKIDFNKKQTMTRQQKATLTAILGPDLANKIEKTFNSGQPSAIPMMKSAPTSPWFESSQKESFEQTLFKQKALFTYSDVKEMSLDNQISNIRDGFYSQFMPMKQVEEVGPPRPWIKQVYSDHCIISEKNKLYKVNYNVDSEGKVKFDDRTEWVEMMEQLVPAQKGQFENSLFRRLS